MPNIIAERTRVTESIGRYFDILQGVTLSEYRQGCKVYNGFLHLFEEFVIRRDNKGLLFVRPSISMQDIADCLEERTGLHPSFVIDRNSRKDIKHIISYDKGYAGSFEALGEQCSRILEHISIRTTNSPSAFADSFYQLNENGPRELLNVWAKLNRKETREPAYK